MSEVSPTLANLFEGNCRDFRVNYSQDEIIELDGVFVELWTRPTEYTSPITVFTKSLTDNSLTEDSNVQTSSDSDGVEQDEIEEEEPKGGRLEGNTKVETPQSQCKSNKKRTNQVSVDSRGSIKKRCR